MIKHTHHKRGKMLRKWKGTQMVYVNLFIFWSVFVYFIEIWFNKHCIIVNFGNIPGNSFENLFKQYNRSLYLVENVLLQGMWEKMTVTLYLRLTRHGKLQKHQRVMNSKKIWLLRWQRKHLLTLKSSFKVHCMLHWNFTSPEQMLIGAFPIKIGSQNYFSDDNLAIFKGSWP